MRILFFLLLAFPALAQLPATGEISMGLKSGPSRSILQHVYGTTTGNQSLSEVSVAVGLTAPHSMNEFRGFTVPYVISCNTVNNYPNGIALSWSVSNSQNQVFIDRSVNGGPYSEFLYAAGPNSSPFNISHASLTAGTSYSYRIVTFGGVEACFTNVIYESIATPPTAPTSVTPVLNMDGTVTVSWSGSTGTVDNYRVQKKINGDSKYDPLSTPVSSPYLDAAILSNSTYQYQVRAENSGGVSSYKQSTVIINTIVPDPVFSVTAENLGGSIDVNWSNPGTGGTVTRIRIERSVNGNAYSDYDFIGHTGFYQDFVVLSGNTYRYRITPENYRGAATSVQSNSVLKN